MATLQGKAVKNTYRQVLQIGANNVGVSGTLQPVQDGAGVNTALSLSTLAATVNGDLTITGDLIITGGGIQIKDLIDDTVAALIQNGTGITWTYNDGAATLTGNFTGTTSVVPEGSNLYYTQGRFDSAFAAKSTTNLAEGTNLYYTAARDNANFASNLAASDTNDLAEGSTNLYFTNARARTALSVTAGTGLSYNNTTGVFNLAAIPNASLTNSSITINGQAVSLGGSVTLTTTNIAEGTNLYWTEARGNSNFATNLAASTTTNLAEGTNLYYTQARFDTAFSNKSTTNLAEGTNLYYTQARFNSALAAKTTTDLAEGTNLYYTDARARLALASSATGLTYANNSGVFSLTAGYAIPTTVKLGQYDIAYNRSIVSAAVSGTTTKTLSLTQQDANVITATWTDQGITTINGTANQIAATTVGNTTTIGFTNDVTMPNNLVVSGNLTINGTATYVNTESISSKDPLFEVANTNNTTDAVDIGYYGRYYDAVQERVEFTGLFRDASDAGKFKIFTGLVDEPTNVVNTTGTGYTVATLVANVDGNLAGTANAANILSTARTIAASGDAAWSVSFDGSANVTSALTLANTGVTATTYGTSTAVPTIAVDSKGRITSASNTNITFPVTTVNGFAGTVVLTTSDVAEGTNQYFTTARAQASITGGASSVVTANLTASRALVSDGSGKIAASATTTTTEIGYLAGVTSAIQTQLNGKLNLTGGTLTGGLIGTTGSFSSSGSGDTFTIGHTSGSGIALNITKDGNGEGLYINKASGSGNALTVIGSTSLGTLSGTSATFSGNVTINAEELIVNKAGGAFITLQTSNTTDTQYIQFKDSGGAAGSIFYNHTNDSLTLKSGGNNSLVLASTGAATFSSRVTADNMYINATSAPALGSPKLFVKMASSNSFEGILLASSSNNNVIAIAHTGSIGLITTNYGTSGANTPLAFGTNGAEQMRISTAGNVGIGTSIIPSKLSVSVGNVSSFGVWSSTALAIDNFSGVGNISQIGFGYFGAGTTNATAAIALIETNGGGNSYGDLVFGTRSVTTDTAPTERMRITSGGNVGIGTSTPKSLLSVAGNISGFVDGTFAHQHFRAASDSFTATTINSVIDGASAFLTFGTNSNWTNGNAVERMRIRANGNVSIGNTGNDGIRLIVRGQTSDNSTQAFNVGKADGTDLIYVRNDGYLYSVGAWSGSDIRLKENITDLDNGLQKVLGLKAKKFDLIDGLKNNFGFIAQEMQDVIPDAVSVFEEKEQLLAVRMDFIIPHLVKAIQEQQAQIEELKAMIAAK
jgi:hypothetical protein